MTPDSAHHPADSSSHRETALAWVALVLILGPTLLRTLVTPTFMPWWDTDPSVSPPTGTSITPSGLLVLDVVTVLGSGLAAFVSGGRVLVGSVLLALGTAAVLWHGAGKVEHLVVGGPWIVAVAAMLGAGWLSRERPEMRGVLLGLGVGVVVLFFARSAVQVWVDHASTVAQYESNKAQVLAAQGWSPGSPQALMYERRLMQPDATAWFGLSNVLATFAAAATVFGIVMGAIAGSVRVRLPLLGLGLVGLILLWMTRSKGGWGAAAIGLGSAGVFVVAGRSEFGRRWRGFIPLAAGLGVLLIVVVRGLIGERIGELSLLFRAQYLEAAVRIFGEHPLRGVGPAGFQQAYLLAKNPLNPEEVSSPHSVLFDWLSTLGVFALPWAWLLVRRCWSRGEETQEPVAINDASPTLSPVAIRVMVLLPILLFAASAWFERPMLLPLEVAARALGVAGWVVAAITIARCLNSNSNGRFTPVLIGVSAAVCSHMQIEMTGIQTGSAPLALMLLGAAWPGRVARNDEERPTRIARPIAILLLVGVASAMGWIGLRTLIEWERHLHAASEPMAAAAYRLRLDPNQSAEAVLGPVRREALDELGRAVDARPRHTKTRIEASRLALSLAVASRDASEARTWLESARGWVRGTGDRPLDARSLRWLASIDRIALDEGMGADPGALRDQMIETLKKASELDPYNADLALRIAEACAAAGRAEEAARWARVALELDDDLRLDPLKRFTPEQQHRLRAMAAPG